MKTRNILTGSILALTLGMAAAKAETYIHVTGSTAFRKGAINAIEQQFINANTGGGNYLDGSPISAKGYKCTFVGSSGNEGGATYAVFEGNMNIAGIADPVVVKCSWSGSIGGLLTTGTSQGGVQHPISELTNGWLDAKAMITNANVEIVNATFNASARMVATGTYTNTSTTDNDVVNAFPDATFTDSYAGTPGFTAGLTAANVTYVDNTTPPAAGGIGVIPFDIVACNNTTATVAFTGCNGANGGNVITYTGSYYIPSGSNSVAATPAQIAAVNGGPIGGNAALARNDVVNTAVAGQITTTTALTAAITNGTLVVAAPNPVPCPITNISENQLQAMFQGGFMKLSQFTGNNPGDVNTLVHYVGRNFDSGTRLSQMIEQGQSIASNNSITNVCPTFANGQSYPIPVTTATGLNQGTTGTAAYGSNNASGSPALWVKNVDVWGAESLYLGTAYALPFLAGHSGYNSGGQVAGALSTPGWTTAVRSGKSSGAPQGSAGWVFSYLGRSDSLTACATTTGPNVAHRVNYNGYADFTGKLTYTPPFNNIGVVQMGVGDTSDGGMLNTGAPLNGFFDTAIAEGLYQGWEIEYLYGATGSATGPTFANAIGSLIYTTTASQANTSLNISVLNVGKSVEGAPILHD